MTRGFLAISRRCLRHFVSTVFSRTTWLPMIAFLAGGLLGGIVCGVVGQFWHGPAYGVFFYAVFFGSAIGAYVIVDRRVRKANRDR